MANSLGKYLSFLFLLTAPNLTALSTINLESNNSNSIPIEYLDQLPVNDYIVGPGDLLSVNVSRDYPELYSLVKIDGEGTIFLPKLNRIYVAGLDISELEDVLNKAFEKYVRFPNVEVYVSDYRAIRVMVDGEVESPGLQTLEGSLSLRNVQSEISPDANLESPQNNTSTFFPTIFDAIRASGGITPFTDLTNIQVIRKNSLTNGGGFKTTNIDFSKVIVSGDTSQNIRIYDSDVIKIKKSKVQNKFLLSKAVLSNLNPKFIDVFVTGRVVNPGKITISKASVLSDAVDLAGGAKTLKGPVTFIRFNNDGTIDKRKFKYKRKAKRGSYLNPMMRNGDLIFFDQSFITSANEIVQEFTSPLVGIFSTYGLVKILNE